MNDVGIALSGGGVAGCAHLGILYGLEKEKIPVRYIAGTSAGAIVAALYAYGYRPRHMIKLLPLINKELVDYDYPSFVRAVLRRGMRVQGLAKGERLRYLIAETTRNARMTDLPLPVALGVLVGQELHQRLCDGQPPGAHRPSTAVCSGAVYSGSRGSTGWSAQVSRTHACAGSSQINQARSGDGPAITLR